MSVSLDNIADLKSGNDYYLSDSGNIEKSGFIHKFKCFFNIGHSRERVVNLINEVQKTLLHSAGLVNNRDLNSQLSQISRTTAVSGEVIKNIAAQFRSVNSQRIIEKDTESIANGSINTYVTDIQVKSGSNIRNSNALRSLLEKVVSDIVNNPPLTTDEHKNKVIDRNQLNSTLRERLFNESKFILKITNSEELGKPKLSTVYLKYLKDKVYDRNGSRIINDITELKPQSEAEKEVMLKDSHLARGGKNAEDAVNYLLERSENDDELREILTKNYDHIIVRADAKIRSLDALKKKIDGIKSNLLEIRALGIDNKKIVEHGLRALEASNGRVFPEGMLTNLCNGALNADIKALMELNANSSEIEIYKGVSSISSAVTTIMHETGASAIFNDNEERFPSEEFITDILISRLSLEQQQSVNQAFKSGNNLKFQNLIEKLLDAGSGGLPDIPNSYGDMAIFMIDKLQNITNSIQEKINIRLGLNATVNYPHYIGFTKFSPEEDDIYRGICANVKKEIKYRLDSFIDKNIEGEELGKQKASLKEKLLDFSTKIKTSFKSPQYVFGCFIKKDFATILNHSIMEELKLLRSGKLQDSYFYKDVIRNLDVNLPDGKKLSNDPLVAQNELARFLTDNPNINFEELDDKNKDKVYVLMTLLAQTTVQALNKGMMTAIEPNRRGPVIETSGVQDERNETYSFTLQKDERSKYPNLSVNYSSNFSVLNTNGENAQTIMTAPQSKIITSVSFDLPPQFFEKISGMNLDEYPSDEINKVLSNKGEYKDISNKYDVVSEKMTQEFTVDPLMNYAGLRLELVH